MRKRLYVWLVIITGIMGYSINPELITARDDGNQVRLDVALDKPYLLSGEKQLAYLRIGLTGFPMKQDETRTPVNMAIVFDKSGSMSGEKIAKAREASIMAIERLNRNDILSFVTYDTTVNVLIPATRISDKEEIFEQIRKIKAGSSTALFAGVSKGAHEVRKFLSEGYANRIVLLSDGLANVGPSSPDDLGNLGESLIKQGISVTTIGLGLDYNEDLLAKLALKSDGTHFFAKTAGDLEKVFDQEFGRALSIVAQELTIDIKCAPGIRPVRVMGREYDVDGQNVNVFINQLYADKEKWTILELEVSSLNSIRETDIAQVKVSYHNMKTKVRDKLSSQISARLTDSKRIVEENLNSRVVVDVVTLLAIEKSQMAVKLRDEGKIDEARNLFNLNATHLKSQAVRFNSRELENLSKEQSLNGDQVDKDWNMQRKEITHGDVYRIRQ
ncbi:VWA domain-containing protein [Candidatus Sumerlaeota bacterium]|nr:VWA domain-containing protein [Candidatus Sumerlaeota bacterium]